MSKISNQKLKLVSIENTGGKTDTNHTQIVPETLVEIKKYNIMLNEKVFVMTSNP